MNATPLETIRKAEIQLIRPWIKPSFRILEVGGGDGYQAGQIASWGCSVESIDISDSHKALLKHHYPVKTYDGKTIPYADQSFDVVFSSNVLEHVVALAPLFTEMRRVLKSDGQAIHILPSTTWRLWTLITHYPNLLLSRFRNQDPASFMHPNEQSPASKSFRQRLYRAFIPPPHGEYPGSLSELYYYSRRRWLRVFEHYGFIVTKVFPAHFFYTGHLLFPKLEMSWRKTLARVLGSSGHIYVMHKKGSV